VQVPHDEGGANHIDPESCAVVREGGREALTGERIGQAIEPRKDLILGADVLTEAEGNMDGHANASARPARRGRRPWHVRTLSVREPGDLTVGQQRQYVCAALVRVGKARSRSR
jgi:hypothetical protein